MGKFETQTSDDADMQLLSSGELEQVAGGCFGIRLKVTYERHNGHLDRVTNPTASRSFAPLTLH